MRLIEESQKPSLASRGMDVGEASHGDGDEGRAVGLSWD